MLDIQFIRQHQPQVEQACRHKGLNPEVVGRLLSLDRQRRDLIEKIQLVRTKRNILNRELKKARTSALLKKATDLKQELQSLEPELKQVESAFTGLMLQIPNLPLPDVPVGADASANRLVRDWGQKPAFDFPPQDHIQLGQNLDLIDLDRGAKVGGFRAYFLKNQAVIMQFGLMRYALDKMVQKGFTPFIPPIINRKEAFVNSGHFPWGEAEAYALIPDEPDNVHIISPLGAGYNQADLNTQSDTYLAGTAEVPLVSYHAGEILTEKDLPLLYAGFSSCYRREIGNYGKDTRGIYRVHEFMKIEQLVFCINDAAETQAWHEKLAAYSEEILQELGLHHRVMLMSTGDMGEPQSKKYDIETWIPGRNDYGETMSDSILGDFQARRANIRYQAKDGSLKFVSMLNNTALASPRILIALWENYQQKDGSIKVPPVLVPYVGFDKITGS